MAIINILLFHRRLTSESDVYRRQIVTSEVDPRTLWVIQLPLLI